MARLKAILVSKFYICIKNHQYFVSYTGDSIIDY